MSFHSRRRSGAIAADLEKFSDEVKGIEDELKEVEQINEELKEVELLHRSLHDANATLHDASAVRARINTDVSRALNKSKLIKGRLDFLDRANAASHDRSRTNIASALRKKLNESMQALAALRARVTDDHQEAMERRYYAVTGDKPDEATVDVLMTPGEGERFLARAARGEVVDAIAEIQERQGGVAELERSLGELQQLYLDMAVLGVGQGEQLDDIEANIGRGGLDIERGVAQLAGARRHKRNTRNWTCFAVCLLVVVVIIILTIVLTIVVPIVGKK